jgi:hypothetical protein
MVWRSVRLRRPRSSDSDCDNVSVLPQEISFVLFFLVCSPLGGLVPAVLLVTYVVGVRANARMHSTAKLCQLVLAFYAGSLVRPQFHESRSVVQ